MTDFREKTLFYYVKPNGDTFELKADGRFLKNGREKSILKNGSGFDRNHFWDFLHKEE